MSLPALSNIATSRRISGMSPFNTAVASPSSDRRDTRPKTASTSSSVRASPLKEMS